MHPGGVNAPPSPQPDPATSALLRGAHRRLGMSKAAQPRPPPAEVRCSRARVGSGSAAGGCGVGRGGAWVSPTTNFSLLGRPGPLLRRESPPCGVDRHGLLSMHITRRGIAPLRLPPALPPRALSFSQGCCSACWHSCIPGASPGLGALAPPAATPAGSPVGVRRVGAAQERDKGAPFPPRFSCPEFVLRLFYYFIILLFFNACFGAPDLASLQSYSMPLVIPPASSPCSYQSFQIKK